MNLYKEDFLKQRMFIFGSFCNLMIFLLQLLSKKTDKGILFPSFKFRDEHKDWVQSVCLA